MNRRPPRPKRGALPTALHPEPLEYNRKQHIQSRKTILHTIDRLPTLLQFRIVICGLFLIILLSACAPDTSLTPIAGQPTPEPTDMATGQAPEIDITATQALTNCTDTQGTVDIVEIPSSLLGEPIKAKIYLPPCYSSNLNVTYSTLYMLHGQMSQYDQWERLGLFSAMDKLLAEGRVDPFIIVLPDETKSNLDAYNSKYGDALINEVIPYIEENYRACSDRSCRAIGGLSRGGNWAVHLGFTSPQTFGAVGAHSAPLFYGELSNLYRIALDPEALKDLPIFYIDVEIGRASCRERV